MVIDLDDGKITSEKFDLKVGKFNNENEYNYLSAIDNMLAMQQEAAKSGASKMTLDEINAEIAAVRKSRKGKM